MPPAAKLEVLISWTPSRLTPSLHPFGAVAMALVSERAVGTLLPLWSPIGS